MNLSRQIERYTPAIGSTEETATIIPLKAPTSLPARSTGVVNLWCDDLIALAKTPSLGFLQRHIEADQQVYNIIDTGQSVHSAEAVDTLTIC